MIKTSIEKWLWSEVRRFRYSNVPPEDLYQEAWVAFCRAEKYWNPEKTTKLTTYATKAVRNQLHKLVKASKSIVPVPPDYNNHQKVKVDHIDTPYELFAECRRSIGLDHCYLQEHAYIHKITINKAWKIFFERFHTSIYFDAVARILFECSSVAAEVDLLEAEGKTCSKNPAQHIYKCVSIARSFLNEHQELKVLRGREKCA